MEKMPITLTGFQALEAEIEQLKKVDRPFVINEIAEAREHGDLKENAEYHAARDKQSFLEGRIQEVEAGIALAEVIDVSKLSGDRAMFGAKVEIVDEDTDEEVTYQIVGEMESDLEKGLISFKSPIARALIGKEEGDSVKVQTPGGVKLYEILSVAF
jgi:transcription elongation factor GreA